MNLGKAIKIGGGWRFCAISAMAFSLSLMTARAETEEAEPDAFLDYIEATGSQYIDTGVNAETGLKARIDFEMGSYSGNADWSFLDAAIDASTSDDRTRFLMCHLYNYKPFFGYGVKQRGNPANSFNFVGGKRYEIVTDMTDIDSLELVQNGRKTFSAENLEYFAVGGNSVNLNLNLYIFACHLSNKAAWFSKGKLYELKIWKKNAQSGELDLIRHYLPCIKGGRAGLYDKVNGTISYSFSSTAFVAGPVLDKPLDFVKWVWADGNQHFDTHVWGKGGLKSEIDISVRDYSGDHCILGARRDGGNTRLYPAYNYESQFRYAYGTMPGKTTINKVAPTNNVSFYMDTRYLIKSDIQDGFQSVTVSKNGGTPTELHKDTAYLTGEMFTTNTLFLLSCHDGRYTGTKDESKFYSNALLYRTTIWDGDELLRDFVPVVATNAAGVAYAGLYDTVTERIYRQLDGDSHEFDLATQVGGVTNTLRTTMRPKTRLEYVDSDELLDYVDLGIIGKDGIEMDAVMEWLRVPTDGAFVGARTNKKNNKQDGKAGVRFFPYHYWNSHHRLGYDGDLFELNNHQSAAANTKYHIVTHLDSDKGYAAFRTFADGAWGPMVERTILSENGWDQPVDTELPLYLFSINFDGTPRYPGKVRLYSLKLRQKQQDGTYALVRDLVPVNDPLTGGAALWDKVKETYFRNSGKYMLAGGGRERPFEPGMIIIVK